MERGCWRAHGDKGHSLLVPCISEQGPLPHPLIAQKGHHFLFPESQSPKKERKLLPAGFVWKKMVSGTRKEKKKNPFSFHKQVKRKNFFFFFFCFALFICSRGGGLRFSIFFPSILLWLGFLWRVVCPIALEHYLRTKLSFSQLTNIY